uniref:Uncharacterized protein n=1 Tax=Aureimonas frigidaquae TaxID=424757 RepID=A0A0P0Z312_9HYPH|nr:hypothetical protein [Aureimonas frigidaquae]
MRTALLLRATHDMTGEGPAPFRTNSIEPAQDRHREVAMSSMVEFFGDFSLQFYLGLAAAVLLSIFGGD